MSNNQSVCVLNIYVTMDIKFYWSILANFIYYGSQINFKAMYSRKGIQLLDCIQFQVNT